MAAARGHMLSDTTEKELTSTNKVSKWSLLLPMRDKCPGQEVFFRRIFTKHVYFWLWKQAGVRGYQNLHITISIPCSSQGSFPLCCTLLQQCLLKPFCQTSWLRLNTEERDCFNSSARSSLGSTSVSIITLNSGAGERLASVCNLCEVLFTVLTRALCSP